VTLDFYRTPATIPFPRSFSTALRAHRHGQLGIEAAIYRAGSVDSIDQRPLNIALIRELLAKSGLDFEINQPVAQVLFDHLEHEDNEVSDFAAQTLARLEERYYREMRRLEQEAPTLKETPAPGQPAAAPGTTLATAPDAPTSAAADALAWRSELSQRYLEFASIQHFNQTLERYYLRKCIALLEDDARDAALPASPAPATAATGPLAPAPDARQLPDTLIRRRIYARLRLGDTETARAELDQYAPSGDDTEWLELAAEIAYRFRRFSRLREIMARLELRGTTRLPTTVWTQPYGEAAASEEAPRG
jgi:hypothetical protein